MLADDLFSNGEAEAGALGFGGDERFAEMSGHVGAEAEPMVGDNNMNVVIVLVTFKANGTIRHLRFGAGFNGVGQKVYQDLLQTGGIGRNDDVRGAFGGCEFHMQVFGQRTDEVDSVLHESP